MFDRPTVRRAALTAAPFSWALILAACGNEPSATSTAQQASEAEPAAAAAAVSPEVTAQPAEKSAVAPAPQAAKAAVKAEVQARELTIEEIAGGWRVVRVEGARPGSKAANMKGAIAEIFPESASWSYKPKGAGALNDFCQEPVPGIVRSTQAQNAVKDRFAKSGRRIADRAVPHELMCASGGNFGNTDGAGTDIALIKPGVMAMTWKEGSVLILEQMDRPQPKENMKPEDYRASDYKQ